MDKVYKRYKESLMSPQRLMDELGMDMDGDSFGMGVIRKEVDLTNDEKQYLLGMERGDIPTTKQYLSMQSQTGININCVDPLGRTALLIAIENENIEMIELLLSYNVYVGDALLHAIIEENVEAVELILNHEVATKGEEALMTVAPSSSFTPDITPIILAGHRDNYEIIKILLDRGFRIPKPHDVRCSCKDCLTGSRDDILRHSRSRINAYRALASPSLIALSSKDPILTSFELSWELKRLSKLENEFKTDYEKLAKKCQDFAVDLLEQIRGSKELEIVLNHNAQNSSSGDDNTETVKLSRLKLAVKLKQKKFVAHPNCQQLLATLWYDGLLGFRRRNIAWKMMVTTFIGLSFPCLSLVYLIAPKSGVGKLIRKPFVKFICNSASYLVFLFLLILVSQRVESPTNYSEDSDIVKANRERRGAPATPVEWMILVYVAGLIWAEIKQLWDVGFHEYVQDMWNILDFITNSLYIATLTLRVLAYLQVEKERAEGNDNYKIQRKDWDAYDPNLIAEAMFAAANIFSSLKLIYTFTVNPHLGPLQISLGRMVMDIMKFGCVFCLVLFSFACGLNHLYWYYSTLRRQECDEGNSDSCDQRYKSFANLFEIVQTLYWAIYGLIDLEHASIDEPHAFTELVGKLMFGCYSAIAIIVLLNMLIAMMSNSYQYISSQSDEEWKFARSKLWISYFEEGGTLPSPFNIIPTPKTLYYILLWFKNKLCACSKRQKRSRWQSIKKIVKKINEREVKYQAVMRDLIKRYIMAKQRSPRGGEGVTEDEINELKQDISSFRFELLEILRSNGMKTPNPNQPKPTNRKVSRGRKKGQSNIERLTRSFSLKPIHETPGGSKKMDTLSDQMKLKATKSLSANLLHETITEEKIEMSAIRSKSSRKRANGNLSPDIKPPKYSDVDSKTVIDNQILRKVDEGLGESFDQFSEVSEASPKISGTKSASDITIHNIEDTGNTEQTGDKMESGIPNTFHSPAELPFSKHSSGPARKVTFLWGGQKETLPEDSVSQTYVYSGQPSPKKQL